ncbi:acetyltransferase Pat [Variibacter gotjawalensis]|uniref:Acetyltransferase Pat n=1 Tax=Variibacter gotjawalensis TaxID=1333996 RepID=A0A0S3PS14_9BRAD|nr:GNAT family N-acetyltransferase [Variibacter gotjawalensis]NIK49040.1 GNAT superfamily N-acetyltransferase [Variibacter gotjawalensis]RZS50896.1 acetyltransferase (GNAT) family protein [Variibacter gotjawalensis]BAT58730.1 acetyltransferase Pat [Variibacter gotjawalensis]
MTDLLPANSLVRKIWITETDAYRDHLLRLDAESRRLRFGGGVSDAFIQKYVKLASTLDAVLYGYYVDGVLRGVAELRAVRDKTDVDAEAAFSIEREWQSHGVGSALMSQMLLAARNRGIRTLHMICLADNQRMQQLAKKFDAQFSFEYGSVIGEVETPYPTPVSVMREVVADSANFATAMLDVHKRLFKFPLPRLRAEGDTEQAQTAAIK